MPLPTQPNEMDGQSVFVHAAEDLRRVPASHQPLVGPEERAALRDPHGYFRRLADAAQLPALRWWLAMLARCDFVVLELHTGGLPGVENEALLRFSLYNGSSPAVRLRSGPPRAGLPSPLDDVYARIDGTNHFGYGWAGGLAPARLLVPMSESGLWFGEDNAVNPAECWAFYQTRSGTTLCYRAPDRAVWYRGGSGTLRDAGQLRAEVERYFTELLRGKALEPDWTNE